MRPLDPAVRRHLQAAGRPLAAVLAAGVMQALLVVAQAFTVAGAVVALVEHRPLSTWILVLVTISACRALVSYVGDGGAAQAAAQVGAGLRRRLLDRIVLDARDDEQNRSTGSVVVLATRGIQETEPYLTRYLPALVLAVALPPLAVLAIATQDLLSALIVLMTLPLVPLFAALVGWRTQTRAQRQWRQMSMLAGHFLDVVKGLPTLVSFRRADHQTGTIRRITHRYRVATMDTLRLAFASSAVLELVATVSVALVAVEVGLRLASGSLGLQTGLTVLLLAPEAYWPLRRVGAEFHAAAQGQAAFAEVDTILAEGPRDEDVAVPDEEHPVPASATPVGIEAPLLAGQPIELDLDGISVEYPGLAAPALACTTVALHGPGLVAVTGPSGSGKSTLLAAVLGRVRPAFGTIEVNGSRLQDLDQTWWSSQVAWLPQRPFFVRGSIADNLRLGRLDAGDDELWGALADVALASLVTSLPGGLAATVDEDGLSLSAGERARLALARVIVARRPVVLLDEPTAHLDAESEQVVVTTIRALARHALVLAVAHQPAVAREADQVIVLSAPHVPVDAALPAYPSALESVELEADAVEGATPDPCPVVAQPEAEGVPSDEPTPSGRRQEVLGVAGSIALGVLASAAGVALTATAGWLIVRASQHPPVLFLLVAIVAVRTFGIARPVLRYLERLTSHDAALRMLAEKRAQVYAALVPLTPGRLGLRRGDVLTSVVDDVEGWVDRRLRVWMPLITLALTGALTGILVALVLPSAALVDVALVVVGAGGVFGLIEWAVAPPDAAAVRERAKLGEDITELVEGSDELRSWGAAAQALDRVDTRSRRLERLLASSSRRTAVGRALAMVAVGVAVAASFAVVGPAVAGGGLSSATGALLVLVPLALGEVIVPVADMAVAEVRTRRALDRLRELLDAEPAVREPTSPVPLATGRHDLEVTDLSGGWGTSKAIAGLDLSLPKGARIGVVGPSGSGKSTLAALLVRFIDPSDGAITYAGTDLRDSPLDDVRRTVGLLDDDPHVFATTLAENIRLARPGASDSEVEAALSAASLGPWLRSLPEGLDTWLGDGNRDVSGGERARLGLARVILAGQPVVVLDEPTAHLDAQTAQDVMRSLVGGAETRSVVLITHRPEGLELVDQVIALDGPPTVQVQEMTASRS